MATYNRKALKRIMAEKHATIEGLALEAQVARGTVRLIECGVSVPRADTLAALASALGVEPGDFFVSRI